MRLLEDDLARELRAIRPLPDPEFAAKLDSRAAEGFSRPAADSAPARLRARLAVTPPRRLVAPLGAAATLIVVVAVAIGQSGEIGGPDGGDTAIRAPGAGAPSTSAGTEPDVAVDPVGKPGRLEAEAGAGGQAKLRTGVARDVDALTQDFNAQRASGVPFDERKVARSVSLALATAPDDFRGAADAVPDIVRQHRGFIVSSSVTSADPDGPPPVPVPLEEGGGSTAGLATFDLRISASRLDSAMAALSDLGHIASRTDGQVDITSRFVSAKKRIAAYTESRENLLDALAAAVTIAEQESIERRLRIVESQLDAARDELADAQRRVRLVPLTLTISSDPTIAGEDDGEWSVGDALDDAGRALEVMAGIALISLAILVPIALVGLVIWLVVGRVLARRRESALDA